MYQKQQLGDVAGIEDFDDLLAEADGGEGGAATAAPGPAAAKGKAKPKPKKGGKKAVAKGGKC